MKNRNNKPRHWGKFIHKLEDVNPNVLNSKEKKILKRRKEKEKANDN